MENSEKKSHIEISRVNWHNCARIAVSVLLVGYLVIKLDLHSFLNICMNARFNMLAITLVCMLAERYYAAYRWYILLLISEKKIGFSKILRITFISNFYGMFLPGGGVELLRIVGLGRATSDFAEATASVFVDRFFGLLTLIIMVLIGVSLNSEGINTTIQIWAWIGFFIMLFSIYMFSSNNLRRIIYNIIEKKLFERLKKPVYQLFSRLDGIKDKRKTIMLSFVLSIGIQILRIATIVFAAWTLHIKLPLIYFIIYVPIIIFIQLLPIAVGGIGVRESAYVFFFGSVGVNPEAAFSLSVLYYFGTVLTSLPGWWLGLRLRSTKLAEKMS